jgi:hypothetical protein
MFGVSERSGVLKIISDLNVIGTLSAGKTLSSTSMTVIDHNSWSGMLWRTYSGENRKSTIIKIEEVLNEAMFLLEAAYSSELADSLEQALRGFETLTQTYKGDYYTDAKIHQIIDGINERITILHSQSSESSRGDTEEPPIDTETQQYIADLVQQQLQIVMNDTQEPVNQPFRTIEKDSEVHSRQNSTSESITDSIPDSANKSIPENTKGDNKFCAASLVKTSDRTGNQRARKVAVNIPSKSGNAKVAIGLSNGNNIRVKKDLRAVFESRSRKYQQQNKVAISKHNR